MPRASASCVAYSSSRTEFLSGARSWAISSSALTRRPGAERSYPARRLVNTKSMSGTAASSCAFIAEASWDERNSMGSWPSGSTTQTMEAEVLSMN